MKKAIMIFILLLCVSVLFQAWYVRADYDTVLIRSWMAEANAAN